MAHKKGVGSSKNGRESESKRLGVKIFGGQFAQAGNIIVRQRGTVHNPGENVYLGKDHTLHAKVDGIVTFKKKSNNIPIIEVKNISVVDTIDYERMRVELSVPTASTPLGTTMRAVVNACAKIKNPREDEGPEAPTQP